MTLAARSPADRERSRQRQKRYRDRQRAGVIVLPVPVDEVVLADALVEARLASLDKHRPALARPRRLHATTRKAQKIIS
jgi:hypothetical protein